MTARREAITLMVGAVMLVAAAIRLDSPGPVFFTQKRVGLHKTYFEILKFRTMRSDTPHDVRCGKQIGAYTIGVATGTFSEAELARHEPWWVTEQLPSATEFMTKLHSA